LLHIVDGKQFYFISFENRYTHGYERTSGTSWRYDYYPNGICRPRTDYNSYCHKGFTTNNLCRHTCDVNSYPDGAAYYKIDRGYTSPFLYETSTSTSNVASGRSDTVYQAHTMDDKHDAYGPKVAIDGEIDTCAITDPD
jgi:hypothetical protein